MSRKIPLLLAHYYTWYGTPWGAAGRWDHWHQGDIGAVKCPNSADTVLFNPAIREISPCAYPLIGPYDSMDREVIRWHMRMAKSAGIDAFSVDWWGDAGWQGVPHWTRDVFEKSVLPVAEQEHFKVCLFDECPQFVDDFEQCITWVIQFLKRYSASPAYLRIEGKPVYSIYQVWEGKINPAQYQRMVQRVEAECGPVYWIIDRMLCRGASGRPHGELYAPEEWLKQPTLDAISGYATFSSFRSYDAEVLKDMYAGFSRQVHAAGKKVMLPLHPGHDNRKINADPWQIPREGDKTLRNYWKAVEQADADIAVITSFNEWPETTVVEPSLSWPDPYLYLKTIAQLRGRRFVAPPLPPMAHRDPLMKEP